MDRCFSVVDLFCGVGGLTQGFKTVTYNNQSFKVVAAVDNWKPATKSYAQNHPEVRVITGDIGDEETKAKVEEVTGGQIDVVIGGLPCEAFSLAGKRDPSDPRALLLYHYVDIVSRLKPLMFVMENVKGILSMILLREGVSTEEKRKTLEFLETLKDIKSRGRKRIAFARYLFNYDHFCDLDERQKVEYVRAHV